MNNTFIDIAPIFPSTSTQAEDKSDQGYAVLAYPLFFIPLIMVEDSAFATYHANQGLALLLACILSSIAVVIAALIAPAAGMALGALALLCIGYLAYAGIRHAAKGQQKPLPFVGSLKLIG